MGKMENFEARVTSLNSKKNSYFLVTSLGGKSQFIGVADRKKKPKKLLTVTGGVGGGGQEHPNQCRKTHTFIQKNDLDSGSNNSNETQKSAHIFPYNVHQTGAKLTFLLLQKKVVENVGQW